MTSKKDEEHKVTNAKQQQFSIDEEMKDNSSD